VNYFALVPDHVKDDGSAYRDGDARNSPFGYLIDLPGYGYGKAPEEKVDAWQAATQSFLLDRIELGNLTRLYLLVDARRGVSTVDKEVMSWMDEASLDYTIVLTKGDCVGRPDLVMGANEIGMRYHSQMGRDEGRQGPFVHVVSSLKGVGIRELMWAIDGDFRAYGERGREGKGDRSVGWNVQ